MKNTTPKNEKGTINRHGEIGMNTSYIPDPNTPILGPALEGACPTLTIHDSLVTTPEHRHGAHDALAAAFRDKHGLIPILRFK